MEHYDLIIIGAGPAGYHAAALAADLGKSVLLIEKEALGGTCLNWGCIPTKTLLYLAKQLHSDIELRGKGLFGERAYDHTLALQWKNKVVSLLQSGVASLLSTRKVTLLTGEAVIEQLSVQEKIVCVAEQRYQSPVLFIASGAREWRPNFTISESVVFGSKEMLDLDTIPSELAIVGAGVIGVEFAYIFSALGSKISMIEISDRILPTMDIDISKVMERELLGRGEVELFTSAKVERIEDNVLYFEEKGGGRKIKPFDVLLCSTGVRVQLEHFRELGIDCSTSGIRVDEQMRTNIPGLYAIGDVTGTSQLAHSAYRMAEVAVGSMQGRTTYMRYHAIPKVVYSSPECASCGYTVEEARDLGKNVIHTSCSVLQSGRSIAEIGQKAAGFCKVIADAETATLLGVHIVAPYASEIIAIAALAIEHELRLQDITEIIFPHPSISELILSACRTLQRQWEKGNHHA